MTKTTLQIFNYQRLLGLISLLIFLVLSMSACTNQSTDKLRESFKDPPESAKPGVYWYFMDGNLSRKEMTKDLESMKQVGINHLIFLEVGIGVPRYTGAATVVAFTTLEI